MRRYQRGLIKPNAACPSQFNESRAESHQLSQAREHLVQWQAVVASVCLRRQQGHDPYQTFAFFSEAVRTHCSDHDKKFIAALGINFMLEGATRLRDFFRFVVTVRDLIGSPSSRKRSSIKSRTDRTPLTRLSASTTGIARRSHSCRVDMLRKGVSKRCGDALPADIFHLRTNIHNYFWGSSVRCLENIFCTFIGWSAAGAVHPVFLFGGGGQRRQLRNRLHPYRGFGAQRHKCSYRNFVILRWYWCRNLLLTQKYTGFVQESP